jgi:hypothetical protein
LKRQEQSKTQGNEQGIPNLEGGYNHRDNQHRDLHNQAQHIYKERQNNNNSNNKTTIATTKQQ